MHGVPINCQFDPLLMREESYSRDNRVVRPESTY